MLFFQTQKSSLVTNVGGFFFLFWYGILAGCNLKEDRPGPAGPVNEYWWHKEKGGADIVVRCKASGEGRIREGEEVEERRDVGTSAVSPRHVLLHTAVSWPPKGQQFHSPRNPVRGCTRGFNSSSQCHVLGVWWWCCMMRVSKSDTRCYFLQG